MIHEEESQDYESVPMPCGCILNNYALHKNIVKSVNILQMRQYITCSQFFDGVVFIVKYNIHGFTGDIPLTLSLYFKKNSHIFLRVQFPEKNILFLHIQVKKN